MNSPRNDDCPDCQRLLNALGDAIQVHMHALIHKPNSPELKGAAKTRDIARDTFKIHRELQHKH